jgi:hypothetical protein
VGEVPEFTIAGTGRQRVADLAGDLRRVDRKTVRAAADAGLTAAAQPLVESARRNAEAILPRHGGLGRVVSASTVVVDSLAHLGGAGVRISVFGHSPKIDAGMVRHPVYGHRKRWVPQAVKPGWFTDAMERGAPAVRQALKAAVDKVVARL